MRVSQKFSLSNQTHFKHQLFKWAAKHSSCYILNGQQLGHKTTQYDAIVAVGIKSLFKFEHKTSLLDFQTFIDATEDWIFCCLAYDLKNEIEDLSSQNYDGLGFPDLLALQPLKVFTLKDQQLECHYLENSSAEIPIDFKAISQFKRVELPLPNLKFKARLSQADYIKKINQLKTHIKRGDIYEINFCQEFYTQTEIFPGIDVYQELHQHSDAPFSAYIKIKEFEVVCSSPERYLQKKRTQLISQPIKGTAKRGGSLEEDQALISALIANPKERAENIMIVDLVRNDLSKIAQKASVNVQELSQLYTFKQVHQLISTVACQLKSQTTFVDILNASFPMGSMTGAPKIEAMKLSEQFETTKRGLYSGSIGYMKPDGDFDFNVVIRSLIYNSNSKYLSYMVGGAITDQSVAELEYEECLLKGKALQDIFCRA